MTHVEPWCCVVWRLLTTVGPTQYSWEPQHQHWHQFWYQWKCLILLYKWVGFAISFPTMLKSFLYVERAQSYKPRENSSILFGVWFKYFIIPLKQKDSFIKLDHSVSFLTKTSLPGAIIVMDVQTNNLRSTPACAGPEGCKYLRKCDSDLFLFIFHLNNSCFSAKYKVLIFWQFWIKRCGNYHAIQVNLPQSSFILQRSAIIRCGPLPY